MISTTLQCVYNDDLDHTKVLMKRITPEERTAALLSRTVKWGRSLLSVSIAQGRTSLIDFLLDKCHADMQQRDESDMTTLMAAALAHQPDVMRCLIHHGADVNAFADGQPLVRFCCPLGIDISESSWRTVRM